MVFLDSQSLLESEQINKKKYWELFDYMCELILFHNKKQVIINDLVFDLHIYKGTIFVRQLSKILSQHSNGLITVEPEVSYNTNINDVNIESGEKPWPLLATFWPSFSISSFKELNNIVNKYERGAFGKV